MSMAARQIPFDLGHRAALEREDFLVSAGNEDAVAWIDRWPDWPAPVLVLYGPPACGKTHLSAVWQDRARARRVDPAALTTQEAEILAGPDGHLVIDSMESVPGNRAAETALFHLYNMLKEQERTALLTMRTAPVRAPFILNDLASRLRAAPAVSIAPPDDALLSAVLVKLFFDRQLAVGEDVLRYILPRIERSFAAARDLVDAVDRTALAEKRAISIPLVREVLAFVSGED